MMPRSSCPLKDNPLKNSPLDDSTSEQVILVDEQDRAVGQGEKMQVHRSGQLHRAFSVFVFNADGDLLLQKRAADKYHSAGLYSNTCCSHPRPGEATKEAAHRRLQEEMGFDCPLSGVFSFRYKARLANHLYEHEYDRVFIGRYDGRPTPDPAEVAEWRWASIASIRQDLDAHPERYTCWFRLAFPSVLKHRPERGALSKAK